MIILSLGNSASWGQRAPASTSAEPAWVGSWSAAQQLVEQKNRPPAPGLSHNTLRQVVHLSVGGEQLRARFSNEFGDAPLVIEAAHIAMSGGQSRIVSATDRALTFSNRTAVTVPPGAMVLSDPLANQTSAMADVAVTIHFGATPEAMTGHPGSRCTSYLQGGDAISEPQLATAVATAHWCVLSGIDVSAAVSSNQPAAVVILGDSITDGRGSGTDRNSRWPDQLERRLAAREAPLAGIGVLNQGIGGNRLLLDGLGPNALARFDRDVAAQSGARWLIVLEGINDIGTSSEADARQLPAQLIAAHRQLIARGHSLHLKVFAATLLPFGGSFYFTAGHEAARQQVNDWMRTAGEFDSVIDFDQAMRDPAKPASLLGGFDSGDHLHPNELGYQHMAAAVNLELFRR
jgi:lysophospholipase L1-like esterase